MSINRAIGTLDPIIYFQNADGAIMLPPTTEDARWIYGQKYGREGWEWREAGTLAEVDVLQKRLVEQERRKDEAVAARDEVLRAVKWREVGDRLCQRMTSAATSPYEREFIGAYLQLREERRDKHRQRFQERNYFLVAREMDSAHSGAADLMHSEADDRWEHNV